MKKLKVYLDTSIINFLEANDAPEYKKATENFFENVVVPEKIEVYISKSLSNIFTKYISRWACSKTREKFWNRFKENDNPGASPVHRADPSCDCGLVCVRHCMVCSANHPYPPLFRRIPRRTRPIPPPYSPAEA